LWREIGQSEKGDKQRLLGWVMRVNSEHAYLQTFKNNKVYCELCRAENCEHIKYTLKIPKVQQLLDKKGWILEEEIIQKQY
jgi:hypothetical protein